MKCKYEGSGVWEGRCKGTKEVDPCPGYDRCERYKPDCKTNGDHVRQMSDAVLARFTMFCPYPRLDDCPDPGTTCAECREKWLKLPYEEDNRS